MYSVEQIISRFEVTGTPLLENGITCISSTRKTDLRIVTSINVADKHINISIISLVTHLQQVIKAGSRKLYSANKIHPNIKRKNRTKTKAFNYLTKKISNISVSHHEPKDINISLCTFSTEESSNKHDK